MVTSALNQTVGEGLKKVEIRDLRLSYRPAGRAQSHAEYGNRFVSRGLDVCKLLTERPNLEQRLLDG